MVGFFRITIQSMCCRHASGSWEIPWAKTPSTDDQRKTDWIDTESLTDVLDPDDPQKTVEDYPAPVRAIIVATTRHR